MISGLSRENHLIHRRLTLAGRSLLKEHAVQIGVIIYPQHIAQYLTILTSHVGLS